MAHAKMPSEVAQRILALFERDKDTLYPPADNAGQSAQVLYGDQDRIGITPTICVEAGVVDRSLASAMGPRGRVENAITVFIIVYYARVDDNQVTKLAAEQCAEAAANYIDSNPQLVLDDDGKVIHGYVRSVDHGYARKNKTLMYGSRLTWVGKTKMQLGV